MKNGGNDEPTVSFFWSAANYIQCRKKQIIILITFGFQVFHHLCLSKMTPPESSNTQQQQPLIYNNDFNELKLSKVEPDWLKLFGPKDDDDEEYGPWLTPRMAYLLHSAACIEGDNTRYNYATPDLPKNARVFFRHSKKWRQSLSACFFRIAMRLEKGLTPYPNCIGETIAVHNIVSLAAGMASDYKEELKYLPKFPNDDNYGLVEDIALQDEDVYELFEHGDDGYDFHSNEDEELEDYLLGEWHFQNSHLHPRQWFHAFLEERFTNHLPE